MLFEKLKQPIFNLFYIMTEGVVFDAGPAVIRKVIFLLFIDVLQVLRVMCSFRYGWTPDTTQIFKDTDLVYLFTHLVAKLIPRYSFFILAAILVLVALMDSYYVVKLFAAGQVQTMWPVKVLRFLVGALVTTFFSSVIKWLLIPVECLASKEKSLSSFIHNEEDRCTPWDLPELLITIPTILLSVCYMAFALGTSYLAFEINPLSRHPRAMYTGRVEMLFTSNKIAVTLLVYFSELITPVAVAVIFFLWTYTVFHKHLTVLPFHSNVTNNVRGGIYGMVLWMSFSTLVVASLKTSRGDSWDSDEHPAWLQPLQYALVGAIVLAFAAGYAVTSMVQYKCGRSIGRLRGDFERQRVAMSGSIVDGNYLSPGMDATPRAISPMLSRTGFGPAATTSYAGRVGVKRGAFDKFFDTDWESRRRFPHEWRAGVVLRHLLSKRNKDDLAFMSFLVHKAMEEHPESNLLQMQVLVFSRFVFRDASEAAAIQKALKLHQKTLPLDFQYILFAAERKNNQETRGADIGQAGAVSGISLMEFEVSFEKARSSHQACVSKMRDFWRHVKKRRHAGLDEQHAGELIQVLDDHEEQKNTAKNEYESLIEKFPQSVQLLRAYAHFCDTVLNDYKQAEARQHQASLLDGEDTNDEKEKEGEMAKLLGAGEGGDKWGAGSVGTSEAESYRQQIQRFLITQREAMMGEEAMAVKTLHRRVQWALVLLLALATAGFVLTDFFLFNDIARNNIGLIDATGLFRAYSISSCFLLRTAWIGAVTNNTELYATAMGNIDGAMSRLRLQHFQNYQDMPSAQIKDFYLNSEIDVDVPVEKGWRRRTYNYWNVANDFARRAGRAAETPISELRDGAYVLGELSEEKANVAYTFENTQTRMVPTFEHVVKMYEDEVFAFGRLATALVYTNACINALLLLAIAFFVIRAFVRVMRNMQSKYVFCAMALRLPRSAATTIFKYYDLVELNMKIVEDEEAERKALMASDADHPQSPSLSRRRTGSTEHLYAQVSGEELYATPINGNGQRGLAPRVKEPYEENDHGSEMPLRPSASSLGLKSAFKHKVSSDDVHDYGLPSVRSPDIGAMVYGEKKHLASPPEPLTIANLERLRNQKQERDDEAAGDVSSGGSDDDEVEATPGQAQSRGRNKGAIERWLTDTNEAASATPTRTLSAGSGKLQPRVIPSQSPSILHTPHAVITSTGTVLKASLIEMLPQLSDADDDSETAIMLPTFPPLAMSSFGQDGAAQSSGSPPAAVAESDLHGTRGLEGGNALQSAAGVGLGIVRGGGRQFEGFTSAEVVLIQREPTPKPVELPGPVPVPVTQRPERVRSLHAHFDDEEEVEEDVRGSNLRDDGEGERKRGGSPRPRSPRPQAVGAEEDEDESESKGGVNELGAGEGEMGAWERCALLLLEKANAQFRERHKVLGLLKSGSLRGSFKVGGKAGSSFKNKVEASAPAEKPDMTKSIIRRMMFGIGITGSRQDQLASPQRSPPHSPRLRSSQAGSIPDSNLASDERPERFHEESMASLHKVIRAKQQWHGRIDVYFAAVVCVLVICVLSMAYPARNITTIVNMAPTTNQAGRRRYLVRSCCHFTRELVLDDGFSRMPKPWVASALRFHLNELRAADRAVRMGGELGVRLGADYRNAEHNVVMYGEGCPWREDPTDCSTPGMEGRGDVNEHGLQYLLISFFDAIETVLARYAPGSDADFNMDFRTRSEVSASSEYTDIKGSAEKRALLASDPDVKFILSAFAGDVFNGLGMTLNLFHDETADVLASTHVETRLLFGIYFAIVALGFYRLLFRRTIRVALGEVEKTRSMVMELPTHVLKSDEVHTMVTFFAPAHATEEEEHDDHAAAH